MPEVPTYRQMGMPITVREWYGVFLPGRAQPEAVRREAAYLQPALSHPNVVQGMSRLGIEVVSSAPQKLGELLAADTEEWRGIIRQIRFTPES